MYKLEVIKEIIKWEHGIFNLSIVISLKKAYVREKKSMLH